MRFEEAPRLTQRLQFIEEAKRQFWRKWMQQVFSGRMLNHKWTKSVRNVAIGDIVYLAEAENDDPTYRLGQIVEACPGEDGCVRTVRVQYTNPRKLEGKRSPPKTTTRPIHKVAWWYRPSMCLRTTHVTTRSAQDARSATSRRRRRWRRPRL